MSFISEGAIGSCFRRLPGAITFLILGLWPALATAQTGDPEAEPGGIVLSLSIRGGIFAPRAESDIFDFTTDRLTLSREGLRGRALEAEVAAWPADHVEVLAGVSLYGSERESEFRGRSDEAGMPLRQRTRFALGPSTYLGAMVHLRPASSAASRWNASVGAGAGTTSYEFRQWGDFWDERAEVVFQRDFSSEGRGLYGFVATGLEFRLLHRVLVTGRAEYRWGEAGVSGSYRGFQPIDLSGLRLSVGLTYRR